MTRPFLLVHPSTYHPLHTKMSIEQLRPARTGHSTRRISTWSKAMHAGKHFSAEQAQMREAMIAELHSEHQGVLKVEAMIKSSMEGVQQTMTERAVEFGDEEVPFFNEINELLGYVTVDQRNRLAEIIKIVIEPQNIEERLKERGLETTYEKKATITKAPKQTTLRNKMMPSRKQRNGRNGTSIVESIEQDEVKMHGNSNKDGKSFSQKQTRSHSFSFRFLRKRLHLARNPALTRWRFLPRSPIITYICR